ncbi:MAG: GntR family transcriptional regulator, partial [Clostridia bacterium]|nr:GntR family transcriptional regulator [Clostridia bacterium]
VRELAVIAGVNPNTVQRALSELEDEGILVSKRGDGRYVADNGTLRDNMLLERSRSATLEFVRAMKDLGLDDTMIRESLEKALTDAPSTKGVDAGSGTIYS